MWIKVEITLTPKKGWGLVDYSDAYLYILPCFSMASCSLNWFWLVTKRLFRSWKRLMIRICHYPLPRRPQAFMSCQVSNINNCEYIKKYKLVNNFHKRNYILGWLLRTPLWRCPASTLLKNSNFSIFPWIQFLLLSHFHI